MLKIKVLKQKHGYTGILESTDSPVKLQTGITRLNKRDVLFDLFSLVNDVKQNDESLKFEHDLALTAYNKGVTDLGQLSKSEKAELNKFVKAGLLRKVENNLFPIPKSMYVRNLFVF